MENRAATPADISGNFFSLFQYCERNNHLYADSICFIRRQVDQSIRVWTWSELFTQVLRAAQLFRELGVKPQSRVINVTRNSLEWILVELACSRLNAIHVPVDPRLPKEKVRRILEQTHPSLNVLNDQALHSRTGSTAESITIGDLASMIDSSTRLTEAPCDRRESVTEFSPNDVANILFTSGTTGTPKGVMLSHRNLVSNALAKLDAMPQFPNDHRLNLLPFSHAYAKTCELATWIISASSIEIASSSSDITEQFPISKPTLFNAVPIVYKRIHAEWVRRDSTPDGLRQLTGGRIRQFASGGAPIQKELRSAFKRAGFPIYQGYGLTEAGPVVCSNRSGVIRGKTDECLEEVGVAVEGVQLRVDSDSRLWVRGPGVMLGYWQDSDATYKKIVDDWLDTGDLAEIDEHRIVRIIGRADDTLVFENGYKIDPLEIEHLVCELSGVNDCVLIPSNGTGYDLVLECDRDSTSESRAGIENTIRKLLNDHEIVHPRRIILAEEAWSEENGLRNYKGAKSRSKLINFYGFKSTENI